MNVVITGSSGFVGQNLTPFLLERGFSVSPLSLRGDWPEKLPERYDAIIHLAGKAHDTKNTTAPEEYFRVNTDLTIKLFDFFLKSKARDFVYFSSVKAVADSVSGVLDESVIPDPRTPYGQSKRKAEEYLQAKLLPEGKRLFILRPCMIHGPGNKGNLNLLYKVVSKGVPWPLGSFENARSFLSIDNLLFVIRTLLHHSELPGGVYNLADDDSLSTNEVIKIIAETKGKTPRIWRIPSSAIQWVARLGGKFKLPLDPERLKKLTENYVVDNTKIKRVLNIRSLPVSATEGLRNTLESFSRN